MEEIKKKPSWFSHLGNMLKLKLLPYLQITVLYRRVILRHLLRAISRHSLLNFWISLQPKNFKFTCCFWEFHFRIALSFLKCAFFIHNSRMPSLSKNILCTVKDPIDTLYFPYCLTIFIKLWDCKQFVIKNKSILNNSKLDS